MRCSPVLCGALIVSVVGCLEPDLEVEAPPFYPSTETPETPTPVSTPPPLLESPERDEFYAWGRLHHIELFMDPSDFETLRGQARTMEGTFVDGCVANPLENPYTWFNAAVAIDGEGVPGIKVRKRGSLGSQSEDKPSFKMKFDTEDGLSFHGVRRLTLGNAKQDPGYIAQCLAYAHFGNMGLPASRCNYATVEVNGEPLGLYVNLESIKAPYLDERFGDDDGPLIEGSFSDLKDGWLTTFEPKNAEARADVSALYEVERVLAESANADLLGALEPLVDIEQFLNFWAAEVVVGHKDGYAASANNFWVFEDPYDGRLHFLPWGMDQTMALSEPFAEQGYHSSAVAGAALTHHLYNNAEARQRFEDILGQHAEAFEPEALHRDIQALDALLRPHLMPGEEGQYLEALSNLSDYAAIRGPKVLADLKRGLPEVSDSPLERICYTVIGHMHGRFDGAGTSTSSERLDFTLNDSALSMKPMEVSSSLEAGLLSLEIGGVLEDQREATIEVTIEEDRLVSGSPIHLDLGLTAGIFWVADTRVARLFGRIILEYNGSLPEGPLRGALDADLITLPFEQGEGVAPVENKLQFDEVLKREH